MTVPFGISRVVVGGREQLAALRGDDLYLLERLLPSAPATMDEALAIWSDLVTAVGSALDAPATPVSGKVTYLIPTVDRPAVYCAGANFADHVAEMGEKPEARAYHFVSPPATLSGHLHDVATPDLDGTLDWEVELAAIIAKPTRGVSAAEALDYVAGYAVSNDVSVRGPIMWHPIFGADWMVAKNGQGLTPLGPSLVPAMFVADPQNLTMSLTVNGITRQDSTTAQMLVTVAEQIESLSRVVELLPGDVILTGTPSGTAAAHDGAYLNPGDVMDATIENLGTLTNRIV